MKIIKGILSLLWRLWFALCFAIPFLVLLPITIFMTLSPKFYPVLYFFLHRISKFMMYASGIFPKVNKEANKTLTGKAKGTTLAAQYSINSNRTYHSIPLPARSSTYFQTICIKKKKTIIPSVGNNGLTKLFKTYQSSLFISTVDNNL